MIKFAKWLRTQFEFPIRVSVYLSPREKIFSNGEFASASFFAPYDKNEEPFIRIATGDYIALRKAWGKNNALAANLCSLAHEIIHYQQWWNDEELSEAGTPRKASGIIRKYSKTTRNP
jgi:hypothetical protein